MLGRQQIRENCKKKKHYDKIIKNTVFQNNNLLIFALENNGGLSKNAQEFCRRIASCGEDAIYELHTLYCEISTAMQIIRHEQLYEIMRNLSIKDSNHHKININM